MDLEKFLGNNWQLYGVTPFAFLDGKAKGINAFEILNGSGLRAHILQDRALDISKLEFKGYNLSYISKSGITSPQYYNPNGYEFLQNFFVGFLTTCGLRNIGAPCSVDGEEFGLHGKISNTPAEQISSYIDYSSDNPVIKISGIVREGRIFRENLLLKREYTFPVGENTFTINNIIQNLGFKPEAYMMMLHINFGYPLLSKEATLVIPSASVEARDLDAHKGLEGFCIIDDPSPIYPEQVFFHTLKHNAKNETTIGLINKKLDIGVALNYNIKEFPYTTQWKEFAYGDYVLGIEPSTCKMLGREKLNETNSLNYLEPGESKSFSIKVDLLNGEKEINNLISMITEL